MHLELTWKLLELAVVQENLAANLESLSFDVAVVPRFLPGLLDLLVEFCEESSLIQLL